MPLYAAMAGLGSLLGCLLLYFLAKKGGEAFFIKKRAPRARHPALGGEKWIWRMLLAALLPPPTPFKIFVFAAGVFEVPLVSFASAIALARAIRYFGIGYLAIRYGKDAMPFLAQHKLESRNRGDPIRARQLRLVPPDPPR